MKPAAQRVQAALDALGLGHRVVELPATARTSAEAAAAVGVAVGQIAKSLVFTVNSSPVLVIASGANRVDEGKLERLAGGRVRRADPGTVRQATGYAIGGIPPLAHDTAMATWVDEDLLGHDLIYAAAGVPECVFRLTPADLVRMTGGQVSDLKEAAPDAAGGAR
ncbi:MAG TPA: YbaK/EbsC family protein [Candidatus Binatia bacterium]|jgi:prolyl-tRNA editing enzyme YbaK/EbsC (Cys-tRNA(Pro) deacylase)|nr:YbaK/EbsC family protein [Candidatus Binatia bacterium]